MTSRQNSWQIESTGDEVVFGKNKSLPEEFNGFLANGTSLTGDLQFSGTLHLNGNFRGTISTADVLIIGETAVIEADIKAGEVQICGKVSGNIECVRRIEITEGGQLRGDVRTPQFIINEGGVFEGRSLSTAGSEQDPSTRESVWEPVKPIADFAESSTS